MGLTAAACLQLTELRLEVKPEKIVYVMVSTCLPYLNSLICSLLHRHGGSSLGVALVLNSAAYTALAARDLLVLPDTESITTKL